LRNGDDLVTDAFSREEFAAPDEHQGMIVSIVAGAGQPEDVSFDELRMGFTAAVSHELRTPLARIMALIDSAELPGADVPRLLDDARSEVEYAGSLIDEILFLSELESGREVVALGYTNALPVLAEVLEQLRAPATRAGVRLSAQGDPDVDLPLRPRMLRIIAENLAENAIRYAGRAASFTLTVGREGAVTVLVAADDGVGVGPRDLPRLFERFWRADAARASRGTGLGLAIVKHVVTAAGGSIEASSDPGRGLQVRCRFPA
jgi:signal transduction histidine kinase